MDAAAMALRQPLNSSTAAYSAVASSSVKGPRNSSPPCRLGWRRAKGGIFSSRFSDQGHAQYYKSSFCSSAGRRVTVVSGKEVKTEKEKSLKKMKKKQLKLLKGLSRDLSTFSQMGFGLDSKSELIDQIKGNMITEATQLLLEQLQKVKAEEKELKRKMKEEKAKSKAALRMLNATNCEISCSSSSDSSDCEVVSMSTLKTTTQVIEDEEEEEKTSSHPLPIIPTIDDEIGSSCIVFPTTSKKIEVCMGGKCKKSGAAALLEEFQRVVGSEGAVSGCKCMGKCRDGPNVKVVGDGVFAGPATASSLCVGVGLEDVNLIVANFIGDHQNQQLGFAAAS